MKRRETVLVAGTIRTVTIIGLAVTILTAVALLLVQSASVTSHVMAETVKAEQEAKTANTKATSSNNNNNNTNTVLGNLFSSGEDHLTSFKPINKTYTKVSYTGNRTIMPPGSIATGTINATERGNLTFNLQPNGISLVEGKAFL